MVNKKHFGKAVEGYIPQQGAASRLVVCGKTVAATALMTVAAHLAGDSITPINLLAEVGAAKVTVAVPGGRDPSELALSQTEGRVPYKPADYFGANQ